MSLNYSEAYSKFTKGTRGILPSGSAVCKQQRHRPACASAQSDQRLCFLQIEYMCSIAFKLAPSETSIFYLVSVAEKAGFGMILSETLKTGFVASMLIYAFIFM